MVDQTGQMDLDLRGTVCPMAFVRLRLYSDDLAPGTVFKVLYEDTNANEPLIRSIEGIGHAVVSCQALDPEDGDEPALKLVEIRTRTNQD